jgi:hypothetical protein
MNEVNETLIGIGVFVVMIGLPLIIAMVIDFKKKK